MTDFTTPTNRHRLMIDIKQQNRSQDLRLLELRAESENSHLGDEKIATHERIEDLKSHDRYKRDTRTSISMAIVQNQTLFARHEQPWCQKLKTHSQMPLRICN